MSYWVKNLKSIRKTSNVTGVELAKLIGITPTSYYRFEAGTRRIYLDKAAIIAECLGCSVDDLMRDDFVITADKAAFVVSAPEGWGEPE